MELITLEGPPVVRPATSQITFHNFWDHALARWGVNRSQHRVEPGLYALGHPTPDSPVFVTANYTLSFDALRSALPGRDAYLLVLDTKGVNVWCASGKGTFGTDELVHRVHQTRLGRVVRHRKLILPQLGAPGVAGHEVKRRTGFLVEYGPVRAADLPEYLRLGQATAEMRRVRFGLAARATLIPVELVHAFWPLVVAGLLLRSPGLVAAILAGVVLFPLLLPYLPTREFTTKGFILGGLVALPFAWIGAAGHPGTAVLWRAGRALQELLLLPPVTAYLALNFTGSSTFTSRTGVRREIFRYVPIMAWLAGLGAGLWLLLLLARLLGVDA